MSTPRGEPHATFDTATGKDTTQPVVGTDSRTDTDLADLTVADSTGHQSTIQTTSAHPFWSDTRSEWIHVSDLKAGEKLHTDDGSTVTVIKIKQWVAPHTMLDLTVNQTHTFYVVSGGTAVLVHNTNTSCPVHGGATGVPNQPLTEPQVCTCDKANEAVDEFEQQMSIAGTINKARASTQVVSTALNNIISHPPTDPVSTIIMGGAVAASKLARFVSWLRP